MHFSAHILFYSLNDKIHEHVYGEQSQTDLMKERNSDMSMSHFRELCVALQLEILDKQLGNIFTDSSSSCIAS